MTKIRLFTIKLLVLLSVIPVLWVTFPMIRGPILLSTITTLCVVFPTFRKILWSIIKWTGVIIGCLITAVMVGDVIYVRWQENLHRRSILYDIDSHKGLSQQDQERMGGINRYDTNRFMGTQR